MPQISLFNQESARAARQPKTDRLILERLLDHAAGSFHLRDDKISASHAMLVKWADMESSGRLAKFKETQMQGQFLEQIFGEALGYTLPTENAPLWHQEQHRIIAGETPDAVLGKFSPDTAGDLRAVVELKGPETHLDRDRTRQGTAIDQCWNYLVNTPPTCRWAVVSNIISFRLYERDSTKRRYEHFTLQGLRKLDEFKRFFLLLNRQGLIDENKAGQLLRDTNNRQRQVGEELYEYYSSNRVELIRLLSQQFSLDDAIEMAQRLFDRVIFIAFCEDRSLLPEDTITKARTVSGFYDVTNPKWQNFKRLFGFINAGNPVHDIPKYNGGLFAPHQVDNLSDLPDEPWTTFFGALSSYDFRDEVNLDVLGHLFERSITELEKYKEVGVFNLTGDRETAFARMPQSVKRKQLGIYYTPPELTSRIVQYTVEELIVERFAAAAVELGSEPGETERGMVPDSAEFWQRCLEILKNLKIVDPACGSGAFLFQAYNVLEERYNEVVGQLDRHGVANADELASKIPHWILSGNLYGVDLSPEAVEITQLALWFRSASRGQTLATLSHNIVHGNSLVHDQATHPAGFDWREKFPEVFNLAPSVSDLAPGESPGAARLSSGFDCVIGNPPWERIKLQEREFFSLPAPEIATATNAAKRRELVAKLEGENPELYQRYISAQSGADALLSYCRKSEQYPLTGRGDTNLYAVFAELAYQVVAPSGRVGLLTPSGIASDMTTKDFFAAIAGENRLIRLYDFENKHNFFPEVHASFKFCILNFGGAATAREAADFIFFAHEIEELEILDRHVALSGEDIRLLNPNTRTCPIFRSQRDAEITKAIYRRVPVLIDHQREGPTGNPWGIKFKTMFHQTNDAELFCEAESLKGDGFKLKGNRWIRERPLANARGSEGTIGERESALAKSEPRPSGSDAAETYLPLYEAKMVQAYDHRAADVVTDEANWVRQGQTAKTSLVNWQNPEHLAMPRFWVDAKDVDLPGWGSLGFKDITSPTNQRTMIAACGPMTGYTNHFILARTDVPARTQACLLANLNSFAFDYCTRQKIGGVTLNFFIVEQIPTFPPDTYAKPCPWDRKQTLENWISERVLKLTCTAEDMLPLAEACSFAEGSFKKEYCGRLNKWDEAERAELMAELDAAYFHLYGMNRADAEYILSTFKGIHDRRELLGDQCTTAQRILQLYDQFAR